MLNVIYEDNHIIVVEKKPNVLCQSDNTKDLDLLTTGSLEPKFLKQIENEEILIYES